LSTHFTELSGASESARLDKRNPSTFLSFSCRYITTSLLKPGGNTVYLLVDVRTILNYLNSSTTSFSSLSSSLVALMPYLSLSSRLVTYPFSLRIPTMVSIALLRSSITRLLVRSLLFIPYFCLNLLMQFSEVLYISASSMSVRPPSRARDFNSAIIDFAREVCAPRSQSVHYALCALFANVQMRCTKLEIGDLRAEMEGET